MAGRLVTGPVADVAGWRWGLAAAALLGVLGAVVVRLLLPASHGFTPATSGVRAAARRLRGAVADPALLALYGIGATGIGAFVAVLNPVGFRLSEAPFSLGVGAASLVFLVYPIGSVGSVVAGRLAEVLGRTPVASPPGRPPRCTSSLSYVGASVFGTLAGHAWSWGAWPAVVGLSGALLVVATLLALRLRATPTLLTASPATRTTGS
jgi:YNFM family putative membrane transporter